MEWKLRQHPLLLEVNAWIWLKRLSKKYGRALTLSSIPAEEWGILSKQGFDLIWLMGIWKRSSGARECALADPALRQHYSQILPNWSEDDIVGSPYAVYDYTIDPQLGRQEDLAKLRDTLHKAGLGLIVDFVPNHLAFDHPRTLSKPECFIRAAEKDDEQNPGLFFKTPRGLLLAHGKDPHFAPWTDTVQINYFSEAARAAAASELLRIAEFADGVRCDMAMLGLNEVFENSWGRFLKGSKHSPKEFWEEIIPKIRAKYPRFIFIAEVYWDLEGRLQQLGFDFTYDKKLYDRLCFSSADSIRDYLRAGLSYQERSVRFIENHDEPRAISIFGREKSYAAATIIATVPGMRFLHDGQQEGKKIHQAIQLGREIQEEGEDKTKAFYKLLLEAAKEEPFHSGIWRHLDVTPAWPENRSYANLVAWSWQKEKAVRLVVVNYSSFQSQGRVDLPKEWLKEKTLSLKFRDRYSDRVYGRDPEELTESGLYVDLGPWKAHLFELDIPSEVQLLNTRGKVRRQSR